MAKLYPELAQYVATRLGEFSMISAARAADLKKIAKYVRDHLNRSLPAKLTFICTHNSRRSQWAQVWAQLGVGLFRLPHIEIYSGGIEVAAFHRRAIQALERAGFQVEARADGTNPLYAVRAAEDLSATECYSKRFDHAPNPEKGYAAILTCAQADDACPAVMSCDLRVPLRFDDPRQADSTQDENVVYDERCQQIAREMLFLFSIVATTEH
ncbi:MAG: protein-tyrosine-phosphatase [Pirellulales bacterium]